MATELGWQKRLLVSALHAAEAVARGLPLADKRLAEALAAPTAQLVAEIHAANLPLRFWQHLIPLAGQLDSRRQAVESALSKTIGRGPRLEAIGSPLAAAVAAIETAAEQAVPQALQELALREGPLREQWEARGPGLFQQIGWLTEEAICPERCDVLLVHPALGGGGEAHLAYNSVRIEAVLANPIADLPEVVRLAWLVSQLQLDLPRYSESIHRDRLPYVAGYAMLPAALAAAETVELARLSPPSVRQAIEAWRLPACAGVDAASLVWDWWQTYQQSKPPFHVAIAALDQMFG